MAVKIRLRRMGKKRQPSYRVIVADGRSPRDGRFIEQIGRYDPLQEPSVVEIDNDRAIDWLMKGAQPTDAARKLLEVSGAWGRFRAARGDIHTVGEPPAPPPAKKKRSKKQKAAEAAGAGDAVPLRDSAGTPRDSEVGDADAAPVQDEATPPEKADTDEAEVPATDGNDEAPGAEPAGDESSPEERDE